MIIKITMIIIMMITLIITTIIIIIVMIIMTNYNLAFSGNDKHGHCIQGCDEVISFAQDL